MAVCLLFLSVCFFLSVLAASWLAWFGIKARQGKARQATARLGGLGGGEGEGVGEAAE